MGRQTIEVGAAPNDGTGDTLRDAGTKMNGMTAELYGTSPAMPAGMWWLGDGSRGSPGAPVARAADQVMLYPIVLRRQITISDLRVRVTTAAASGNVQLAIYAADAATLAPTGAPLYSSGSSSTAATGAVGPTGMSLVLQPGVYWIGSNVDASAASAIFVTRAPGFSPHAELVGVMSATEALTNGTNATGVQKAQAFGGWPTLTGSYSADGFTHTIYGVPLIAFKTA